MEIDFDSIQKKVLFGNHANLIFMTNPYLGLQNLELMKRLNYSFHFPPISLIRPFFALKQNWAQISENKIQIANFLIIFQINI